MTRPLSVLILVAILAAGCGKRGEGPAPAVPASEPAVAVVPARPAVPELGDRKLAATDEAAPVTARIYLSVTGDAVALGRLDGATDQSPVPVAVQRLDDEVDRIYYPDQVSSDAAAAPADGEDGWGDKWKDDPSVAAQTGDDGDAPVAEEGPGQGGAIATLTGTSDFMSGMDRDNALGGLIGDEVGEMEGSFGFGGLGLLFRPCVIGDSAPLLVVDRATELGRIVALLEGLRYHGARLAVAGGDGGAIAEHPVRLGRVGPNGCSVAPSWHRDVGDAADPKAVDLLLTWSSAGFHATAGEVERDLTREQLSAGLRELVAGRPTALELVLDDPRATVAGLVEVMDAAAAAGLHSVYLARASDLATGWGALGTGRYGTIGHGSGSGSGYGSGSGRPVPPQVRPGNAATYGSLDKNLIRRYIRRSLAQVRFCYEKRLIDHPDLTGTVKVDFRIGPNGSVISSVARGMDKTVSDCVARVIRGLRFPAPKGGGVVDVHYPFTFKPAPTSP